MSAEHVQIDSGRDSLEPVPPSLLLRLGGHAPNVGLDRPVEPCGPLLRSVSAHDTTRPTTLNAERREHWRAHRETTRLTRERWVWLWRQAGAGNLGMTRVVVEVQAHYKNRPADTAACVGSAKAAVDALVDVGGLVGDTGRHVRAVTFLAPLTGVDGLTVTVTEVQS